jgi:hypothetical protein
MVMNLHLKKILEVHLVSRKSLRLQAKNLTTDKEEKIPKEDDSVISDMETYYDSDSPGQADEAS